MKNTERFSNRVENYIRYRPHYPAEIIPFLKEKIGLNKHWNIADIGSGTGISSELFLGNGNRVYGVEPNLEMRKAAEHFFENDSHFISIDAPAEAIPLPDGSVDLIVAGQAFHWFDTIAAKKEFLRVIRPGGYLLLMWNVRKSNSEFLKVYDELLHELSVDYDEVKHRSEDEEPIRALFSPEQYSFHSFPNSQTFDLEGLKGRLLSCSYAPTEGHINYKPMMERLERLFKRYQVDSVVRFEYSCHIYYGQILNHVQYKCES